MFNEYRRSRGDIPTSIGLKEILLQHPAEDHDVQNCDEVMRALERFFRDSEQVLAAYDAAGQRISLTVAQVSESVVQLTLAALNGDKLAVTAREIPNTRDHVKMIADYQFNFPVIS